MAASPTSGMRNWKPSLRGLVLTACVAAGSSPVFAAAESTLTDEQVVNAMKKGVDFLLKSKKVDNWESGTHNVGPQKMLGGETALALYALLHAGQSLQDEPEYQAKLHWRSAEIAPVIT